MQTKQLFDCLFSAFGKQGWWPVTEKGKIVPSYKQRARLTERQKLEICFGAILAQNTAWKNAEKAIIELNKEKMVSCKAITKTSKKRLAALIRSSGYFNQKTGRLKLFCLHVQKNHGGKVSRLLSMPVQELRKELLSLNGIGKETADSMILFAARKPVFVVDAYTKRLAERLKLCKHFDYDSLQAFFESRLPRDAGLFAEFHALIVEHAKRNCKKKPDCGECILGKHCFYSSP